MYLAINGNCINSNLPNECVDLGVHDPSFGIKEANFGQHYNRKNGNVIHGYVEAPNNYYGFTTDWMTEAKRVLKPNGSMYIISGWTNSDIVGRVIRDLGLALINKLIWNFPFGVYTKNKYVTSHYEIFYVKKSKNSKPVFNTFCRFDKNEIASNGNKLNYIDRESVWKINKEYHFGQIKNVNKLPEELIKKMIQYSSNEGDLVCDFFAGNFTVRDVCLNLNRHCICYELNKEGFDAGIQRKSA